MRRPILLALLLVLSGCRLFRAEVGVGLGIGADVHVSGLVHAGLLATSCVSVGNVYGKAESRMPAVLTVPLFHGETGLMNDRRFQHTNFMFLPPLTAGATGFEEGRTHPWALEVTVACLVLTVRLGLDPIGAVIDALSDPEPAAAEEWPPEPEGWTSLAAARSSVRSGVRELAARGGPAEARAYLERAVASYALCQAREPGSEREARRERIRRAVLVAGAGRPVTIDELTRWARSRLEGDDADARAATVARELARHCGVR